MQTDIKTIEINGVSNRLDAYPPTASEQSANIALGKLSHVEPYPPYDQLAVQKRRSTAYQAISEWLYRLTSQLRLVTHDAWYIVEAVCASKSSGPDTAMNEAIAIYAGLDVLQECNNAERI